MNDYPNDTCAQIAELINIKPDVETAKITSRLGNPLKLSYKGKVFMLEATEKGKSYRFNKDLKLVQDK